MKTIRSLLFVPLSAFALTGCINGRTEKLVTSDIVIRHGTNEVRIANPKDVSFDDAMVSPSDGTVRIKGYRSTANEAAIRSAEEQAKAQAAMFGLAVQTARDSADMVLRAYGVPVPQRAPLSPILPASTGTNTAK
jgi:hypothetical protein